MDMFPRMDPIPLPAPVWVFKALHSLTLTLHFATLHLLLGGLIAVTLWAVFGGRGEGSARRRAAGAGAAPLPLIMTFVINFGVPPLLFTQVIYGRALYTTSVLIGALWISVIGLVMLGYFALYMATRGARSGARRVGLVFVCSLAAFLAVAFIYANNMTLMLRPERWAELYRHSPVGRNWNSGDPTLWPRLSYMLAASLSFGGVGLWLLGCRRGLDEPLGRVLRRWGALQAGVFAVVLAFAGLWAMQRQPAGVAQALSESAFYSPCMIVWAATAGVVLILGLLGAARAGSRGWLLPSLAGLAAFVNIAAMVLVRDGVRDATLLAAGFDVWARDVTANWTVVGMFLALLILGLITLGWMVWAVARGKGEAVSHA